MPELSVEFVLTCMECSAEIVASNKIGIIPAGQRYALGRYEVFIAPCEKCLEAARAEGDAAAREEMARS